LTRRARIEKAGSDFTSVDFAYMMGYWNDRCAVCGKQAGLWHTLAVDHWIPVSKGGGSTKTNLVPLCHARQSAVECCNQNKSDKDPVEWLEGKFGKRKAAQILKRINAYFNALKGDDNGKH
jgi:5-methylcytosine-specific restriction endonuclease McrA